MEPKVFKYRFSHRTLSIGVLYLVVLGLVVAELRQLYVGGYLSAWFLSVVFACMALMALSIPRKIVVRDATLEILCLLDMTEIPRIEIASVRRVSRRQMRWFVPLFAGYGFFGYYGHFFNLRRFERVRIYASEWNHFVEITDIYEQRYYVSCDRADELIAALMPLSRPAPPDPDDEEDDESAAARSDDSAEAPSEPSSPKP